MKRGFRTCFNCTKYHRCKLLKLPGVTEESMYNCCPDFKPKTK